MAICRNVLPVLLREEYCFSMFNCDDRGQNKMTEQQATLMKNMFCSLALGLAVLTLTGCGLKGPLYFPPADTSTTAQSPEQQQIEREKAQQEAEQMQQQDQSMTPDRNDRGLNDNSGF